MKKNKMLRTASAMLILTIITISIIGGALAKYVAEGSGTDTARVAKFGVVASVQGNLFGRTYAKATEAKGNQIMVYGVNAGTVSAASPDPETVVAPGTENKKGMKLSIAGTPEVSTKVTFGNAKGESGTYTNSSVYLVAGDYGIMVPYKEEVNKFNYSNLYTYDATSNSYSPATKPVEGTTDPPQYFKLQQVTSFSGGADYYPLKWYVGDETFATQAEVVEKLKLIFNKDNNDPNIALDLAATVGWEWKFQNGDDQPAKDANDKKDTILGDMIAEYKGAVGTPEYDVVAKADGKYTAVDYKVEPAAEGSATEVVNVYVKDTKVACLTAAFNVSLKVEQID